MKAHNIISMTLAGLLSNVVLADTQVIHAGELLAVPGNSTLKKQTIVITDGKISQIKYQTKIYGYNLKCEKRS